MGVNIGFKTGDRIIAYDFETKVKVGEYDSMRKATRSLFIRSESSIYTYLFGNRLGSTFTGTKRGVADYKTGKKYHFELAQ